MLSTLRACRRSNSLDKRGSPLINFMLHGDMQKELA